MKVEKNWTSGRTVFSLSWEKKDVIVIFLTIWKIQDFYSQLFLHLSFVSVVYHGCKGIFVNIRYFTETMITIIVKMMSMDHLIVKNTRLHTYNLQSWDRWLSFDKNVIDNSVACFHCPQWLWRSVCEYQILYRNYDHSYCVNDVCGAS